MHPAFEEITCNLCQSSKVKIIYPATLPQDLSLEVTKRFAPSAHTSGHDQIVKCLNCGLVYANPRMKQKYIWQGYKEANDKKYADQAEERLITFKRTIKIIEHYTPANGKLLDIGCAAGFFLKVAKDAGWEVLGLEPNKDLSEFGRRQYNLPIESVDLLDIQIEPESFDVITFWDVLEHVTDPSSYLARAYQLLRPGGYIFINFPDFGSYLAKITGRRWWFLSPVHLYYFDRQTLARMLSLRGFSVVKIKMHWQTLALGYLFERFADYNKPIAKLGTTLCKILKLEKLPIRYYASQALAIAQKPK